MAVGIYGVIDGGSLFGLGLPDPGCRDPSVRRRSGPGGAPQARSRYRPDPWRQPEWIVAGSGVVALGAMSLAHALDVPGVTVSFKPLTLPRIPLLPVGGILVLVPPLPRPNPGSSSQPARVEAERPPPRRQRATVDAAVTAAV